MIKKLAMLAVLLFLSNQLAQAGIVRTVGKSAKSLSKSTAKAAVKGSAKALETAKRVIW